MSFEYTYSDSEKKWIIKTKEQSARDGKMGINAGKIAYLKEKSAGIYVRVCK